MANDLAERLIYVGINLNPDPVMRGGLRAHRGSRHAQPSYTTSFEAATHFLAAREDVVRLVLFQGNQLVIRCSPETADLLESTKDLDFIEPLPIPAARAVWRSKNFHDLFPQTIETSEFCPGGTD
jgi:hypothetical protein